MPLPWGVGRRSYFEIRKVRFSRQREQSQRAFLNPAFQIVHDQCGLVHILNVELGLRARNFQAHMEPLAFGYIDRGGEAGPIVDLPVAPGVENRRVLHGIRKAGLVLAEIDFFIVCAIAVDAHVKTEKTTNRRRGYVHIDDRVAHFEIFDDRGAAVDEQTFAALVFGDLGLPLQVPPRRIPGKAQRLWRL